MGVDIADCNCSILSYGKGIVIEHKEGSPPTGNVLLNYMSCP